MNKSILIADDEDAIRDSLTMVLEEEGYTCVGVSDGQEALAMASKTKYDLIILDLLMPKKTGGQVLAELKKIDSKTPVLILSSYYDSELAAATLKQGAAQYLIKPIDFEDLTRVIRFILNSNTEKTE